MAIKRQLCVNHPDRPAIGICMVTKRPICAECSTRYEGVNYSKEGLALLKKERQAEKKTKSGNRPVSIVLAMLAFLLLVAAMFYMYKTTFIGLIDMKQAVFQELQL